MKSDISKTMRKRLCMEMLMVRCMPWKVEVTSRRGITTLTSISPHIMNGLYTVRKQNTDTISKLEHQMLKLRSVDGKWDCTAKNLEPVSMSI